MKITRNNIGFLGWMIKIYHISCGKTFLELGKLDFLFFQTVRSFCSVGSKDRDI